MSEYQSQPAGPARVVLHVDMDAFFASIAQLDNPKLRGKPVIVGGHSVRRGVVSSASYEARVFGVRSAMPLYQALERCPQAIVVPATMARYREVNHELRRIWSCYSPAVEVASFDEAYLDLTGCEALLGAPVEVARALKAATLRRTGLSCSVGIGANKLVAKVASKKNKPDGLCVVPAGKEAAWLANLPIQDLHGLGPKTAVRLAEIGIRRVGQLREVPVHQLAAYLGPLAQHLSQMAHGIDTRPVTPEAPAKSIGAETTFDQNLTNQAALRGVLLDQVQETAFRLRHEGLLARTVSLKLRYEDFETVGRSRTLAEATDDDQAIAQTVLALWREHAQAGRPVRLVGVTLSNFTTSAQLSWLSAGEREERKQLNQALDHLRERHGLWVVTRGSHLSRNS